MGLNDARTALVTAVQNVLLAAPFSLPANRLTAENMPTPDQTGPWVRFVFYPARPTVWTLGNKATDLVPGLLVAEVSTPLDQGADFGLKALDALRTALYAGKRLTFGGQEVTVVNVGADTGRVFDLWYRTDIQVQFRAYVTRGGT
jgi:hypothetical protein